MTVDAGSLAAVRAVHLVTADGISAYRRAVGCASGDLHFAPPLFPVVAAGEPWLRCVEALLKEFGLADVGIPIIHVEQDIAVRDRARPGDELDALARITAIRPDAAGTWVGGEVTVRRDETLLVRFAGTCLLLGTRVGTPSSRQGGLPPGKPSGHPVAGIRALTVDQPAMYAEASGDWNPIHIDQAAAHAAGLPGVVLHGMCALAIVADVAVGLLAAGDEARLRRVAARFSKPILPGTELVTTVWSVATDRGTHGFRSESGGATVLKRGVIELAASDGGAADPRGGESDK